MPHRAVVVQPPVAVRRRLRHDHDRVRQRLTGRSHWASVAAFTDLMR
jgi:hypothetical protein